MSRKGNCWDNAVAEAFFATLKKRMIYHRKYETKEDLQRDLFWYIEIYYNRVRKHSANGWKTPDQMEQIYFSGKPECMV
jgi:transposase InsO family protein